MENRLKLRYCVIFNIFLFIIIIMVIAFCKDDDSTYINYGPNDELSVLNVKIDNIKKYMILQLFMEFSRVFMEFSRVFINEIASPLLAFSIYNPDKKIITDFTKNELQLLANLLWLINSLISTLFIMITITQIDIAVLRVIYSEITTIITIRLLLNEKEFINENDLSKNLLQIYN